MFTFHFPHHWTDVGKQTVSDHFTWSRFVTQTRSAISDMAGAACEMLKVVLFAAANAVGATAAAIVGILLAVIGGCSFVLASSALILAFGMFLEFLHIV